MSESYDIEPWMPGISPAAPVPAPDWVPAKVNNFGPGTYFSHSFNHTRHPADSYFKNGLRVKATPEGHFRATAYGHEVTPKHLKEFGPKETFQRVSNPHAAFSKKTLGLPEPGRSPGKSTLILQAPGDPKLVREVGPNYRPNPGADPSNPNDRSGKKIGGHKGNTGTIDPKTIKGVYHGGSNQMMTKPGFFTGKMPRGFGAGAVDMFSFPGIPGVINKGPVETEDIFGRPIEDKRSWEEMVATGDAI